MATSGSTDFKMTCSEIVHDAMQKLGVVGATETPSNADMDTGRKVLNMMVKAWQNKDVGMWFLQEANLFLQYGQRAYSLGPSGDHCTLSYVRSALAEAAEATDTTLYLDASDMSTGDYIGIVLDDGTLDWKTLDTTHTATDAVITEGLSGDAAAGNYVFAYSTKIQRPVDVLDARFDVLDGGQQPEIEFVNRSDFFKLYDRVARGQLIRAYYDPQLTNSRIWVWPTADNVNHTVKLTLQVRVEDLDALTDDIQFPSEWLEALTYNLAKRLCPYFLKPVPPDIDEFARTAFNDASMKDEDSSPFRMGVRWDG